MVFGDLGFGPNMQEKRDGEASGPKGGFTHSGEPLLSAVKTHANAHSSRLVPPCIRKFSLSSQYYFVTCYI